MLLMVQFIANNQYSQNKYETYSTKEHKDKIKRPSNPRGTYKKNKK